MAFIRSPFIWYIVYPVIFAVLIVVITTTSGCATYHERDGVLRPNQPSAKELREICPM
jgi:hypothetical protein